jgi:hypothetical protein
MDFSTLTIRSEPKKNPEAKTHTFSVQLLGFLTADPLWEPGGNGSASRPVWIAYAGTERESSPFTANFRAGRKAGTTSEALEIPKRGPHRWSFQKVPGGIVTVAYIPSLFHLEPVTQGEEDAVRFVFAPPRWWVTEQARSLASDFGDEAQEAARAALFCAYLDRRIPLPLVHDLRFHLQVYRAACAAGLLYELSRSRGGRAVLAGRGAEACGLDAPVALSVGQSALADFLIEQTQLYHQKEIRRGKTRISASGRLLSYPIQAPVQLCLDLAVA